MLIKLLKYEFQATSRTFLPTYAALLGVAILNRFISFKPIINTDNSGLLQTIFIMVFVALLCVVGVITFMSVINRFRTNLLGDEGYLMFTLPVKSSLLIVSKLITSFIWCTASLIVTLLAFMFLSASFGQIWGFILELFRGVGVIFTNMTFDNFMFGIGLIMVMILSGLISILVLYASMAIGHLGTKHRTALSILAFLGICTLGDVALFTVFSANSLGSWIMNTFSDTGVIWLGNAVSIVTLVVLLFVTDYILKRRLNLE